MWNRPRPRPKLTVHNTSRHLSEGERARGSGKFLAIAVVIMILASKALPSSWFAEPEDFRPAPKPVPSATVPIEKEEPPTEIKPAPESIKIEPAPERESMGPAYVPAWRRYAVPVMLDPVKPKLAIVIDDMGVNQPKSREIMSLQGALTLSFLPYAKLSPVMAQEARALGHEIMVHVPMEPLDPLTNPGPHALRVGMTAPELEVAIESNLKGFSGYAGINNHMGSKFTRDRASLNVLMSSLRRKGVYLLDSKTIGDSQAYAIAQEFSLPATERDVFLDDDPSYEAVLRQLAEAKQIARHKGYAVMIGHPKDGTIRALREFLAGNSEYQVVPLSAIIAMNPADVAPASGPAPEHLPPPAPVPEPY